MIILAPCNTDYDTDGLVRVQNFKDLARISKHESVKTPLQKLKFETDRRLLRRQHIQLELERSLRT